MAPARCSQGGSCIPPPVPTASWIPHIHPIPNPSPGQEEGAKTWRQGQSLLLQAENPMVSKVFPGVSRWAGSHSTLDPGEQKPRGGLGTGRGQEGRRDTALCPPPWCYSGARRSSWLVSRQPPASGTLLMSSR